MLSRSTLPLDVRTICYTAFHRIMHAVTLTLMMQHAVRRPGGNLDLADVEAVEANLADARDVVAVATSGAKFGQAEQVPLPLLHVNCIGARQVDHAALLVA